MCSNCAGDYEDPEEMAEEGARIAHLGTWAAVIGIVGTVSGFLIAWVYPAIHRILMQIF
jgi:hypothetical protein